jgi:hypothetical protein
MDEAERFVMVSGMPGEPVPQVDPEDVKAVWNLGQAVKKSHTRQWGHIRYVDFEHTCKPGTIVQAVVFRANMVGMLFSWASLSLSCEISWYANAFSMAMAIWPDARLRKSNISRRKRRLRRA